MADLALAVSPAEVDLTSVAEVQEVDQAEAEVLGRPAELDDLAETPTDLAGQPLDLVLVSAPGPTVENAAESFALVATTEDCQEGLNAFVEKRTPNYRGR